MFVVPFLVGSRRGPFRPRIVGFEVHFLPCQQMENVVWGANVSRGHGKDYTGKCPSCG